MRQHHIHGTDGLYARHLRSWSALGRDALASRQICPLAIISLASGILTWIAIPMIGAVAAIILGHVGRRRIRRSAGVMAGEGMAVAGLVLGYAQLCIVLLLVGLARLPPSIG